MFRCLFFCIFALCFIGCTTNRYDVGGFKLPKDPLQITIVQRHSKYIPGSNEKITIGIGDITGGQVLLGIRGGKDKIIVDTISVKPDDVIPFQIGKEQYYISVVKLRNFFSGDDFAVFEISSTRPPPKPKEQKHEEKDGKESAPE